ncbi:hypothetical protein MBUL_00735 [Methylobacterium bullatum]|uniref:Glycine zipper domain-containing protein n=1 Tax=Methylobacterium bullatum TaxID=570505 RepID=A0A679J2R4_9HYPH|nr:hypothetical protein MBUL_00735 [Methylobacterium bullatum]
MKRSIMIMVLGFGAATSSPCLAQGFIGGATAGIDAGGEVAGPVGAALGGAVGAATGTIRGILGSAGDQRRRAHFLSDRSAYGREAGADEEVLIVDPLTGRIIDIID